MRSRFVKAEWESAVSRLPYYILNGGDPPPVRDLDFGVYLVRDVGQDLTRVGYASLPKVITLEKANADIYDLPTNPYIRDVLPLPDDKSIIIHDWDLKWMARYLYDNVGFMDNRLFWTLRHDEAAVLMAQWIEACFTERCVRCGVYFGRDWDDRGCPIGFLGVRRVDEETEAIDLVGVHRSYRGIGIGKELVRWALSTSRAETMVVRTEEWNRGALRMYEKCGFTEVKREPQYWVRIEE